MANTDRPHGFDIFGPLLRLRPYDVVVGYGTAIFVGDVAAGAAAGGIEAATTVTAVTKVGSAQSYSAASTAATAEAGNPVLVADDPHQMFEAQDDAGGTSATTWIHNSFDHVAGAGSTTTLLSAHELGGASASTSDGGFVILDLVTRVDNTAGDNADWVCQMNQGESILTLAGGV